MAMQATLFRIRLVRPFFVWLLVTLGVMGVDYMWHQNIIKSQFERMLVTIEKPIGYGLFTMGAPKRWIDYNQAGLQRIADLEERLHLAVVEREEYERLQDEVLGLTKLLNADVADKLPPVILVTDLVTLGEEQFIYGGYLKEITTGMMVTDESGALVGQVTNVGRYLSKVELKPIDGEVIGLQTRPRGTLGKLETLYPVQMTEVLQSEPLQVGDVVVTDGRGGYPPGVLVGQITQVYSEPSAVTKSAALELQAMQSGKVKVY
jgi:cell shape-determining protein MreC